MNYRERFAKVQSGEAASGLTILEDLLTDADRSNSYWHAHSGQKDKRGQTPFLLARQPHETATLHRLPFTRATPSLVKVNRILAKCVPLYPGVKTKMNKTFHNGQLLCCLRALTFLFVSQVLLAQSARVTIRAINEKGESVSFKLLSFTRVGSNVNLANRLRGDKIDGVEFGSNYAVTLEVTSPRSITRTAIVSVNNFHTLALVPMIPRPSINYATAPKTRFIVRPTPAPGKQPIWVTVRPAFSTTEGDLDRTEVTEVGKDGRFELQGVHEGLSLLTIYRDSRILKTEILEVPPFGSDTELEIRIAPGTGAQAKP